MEVRMFTNILIPTDGSTLSEKVVRDGTALAKLFGARLTGVHVVPATYIIHYGEIGPIDVRSEQELRDIARLAGGKFLDHIETAAKAAGVAFERALVESDDAWRGILEAAKQKQCDLIIMAAHGRRGIAALVLGSETNKVLTHSTIPVLVYR
jgi:nucleotide-binding universal stress UspA family protein